MPETSQPATRAGLRFVVVMIPLCVFPAPKLSLCACGSLIYAVRACVESTLCACALSLRVRACACFRSCVSLLWVLLLHTSKDEACAWTSLCKNVLVVLKGLLPFSLHAAFRASTRPPADSARPLHRWK